MRVILLDIFSSASVKISGSTRGVPFVFLVRSFSGQMLTEQHIHRTTAPSMKFAGSCIYDELHVACMSLNAWSLCGNAMQVQTGDVHP